MELVILCGLQASGKSTFRRERLGGHLVVSKDLMPNNRRRELRQRELIVAAVTVGRSVVVDNTNPGVEDRRPLVDLGRQLEAEVVGYYFESSFEACLERNATRSDREQVPYVGLVDVARRLRVPSLDEGFDALWLVRSLDGHFELRPLNEDGERG